MRTALWLALRQGRAGVARQAVIAIASLLATVIALTSTAFWQAWGRQDQRRAAFSPLRSVGGWTEDPGMLTRDHTTWSVSDSRYGDRRLTVVRVATTGAHAPHPKAITRLPAPGEALVSPPLADLVRETGAPLVGRRGTRIIGSVPQAYLATPDDLVAIVGLTPSQLPRSPQRNSDTALIWSFDPPRGWPANAARVRADATNQRGGLVFILIPLIGSLLAFISNTGRFALLSRRRRASSAALVGATPAQARAAIAMESAVGSLTGAVLGVGLTALLIWARPQSSAFGLSAFRSDLSVPLWLPFATIGVVVGLAVCSAVLGVRRASVAPLDTRGGGPRPSWLGRLTVAVLILGLALVPLSVLALGTSRRTLLVIPLTIMATFAAFAALNMVGTGLMLRVAERLRDGRTPAGVISGARLTTHYGSANRTFRVAAISLLLGTIAVCGIAVQAASPDPLRADLAVNLDQSTTPGPDIRPFLRQVKFMPGIVASTTVSQAQNLAVGLPRSFFGHIETGDCGALARVRRLPISLVCPDGAVVSRSTGLRAGSTIQLTTYVGSGSSSVGRPVRVARVVGDGWETNGAVFIPPRLLPIHHGIEPLRIEIATAATPEARRQVAERIALTLPTGATLHSRGEPTDTWSSGAKSVALLSVIVLLGALTGAIATIEGLLERRPMYERLIALGSPRGTLVGAAAIEAAVPCSVATVGAVVTGLAIGIPFAAKCRHGCATGLPDPRPDHHRLNSPDRDRPQRGRCSPCRVAIYRASRIAVDDASVSSLSYRLRSPKGGARDQPNSQRASIRPVSSPINTLVSSSASDIVRCIRNHHANVITERRSRSTRGEPQDGHPPSP